MTTDLWVEASRDVEAENRRYALEIAKSAGAGTWSFLALAQSRQEFADRVALASTGISAAAARAGIEPEDLLQVFTERFALLMQAKGDNPFADKDDDAKGDGKSDAEGDDDADQNDTDDSNSDVDDAGTDDADTNGKDGDDDTSQDDGGSDNADDDEKGEDKDPDQDDDLDQRTSPAFGGLYSSLMQRITAGEDPLSWGGTPFVGSLGRTAAGAGEPPVTDTNTPDPAADAGGPGPGGEPDPAAMPSAQALTTKPRQQPGGDQGLNTPPGDPGLDPAMNGGDIEAGQANEVTAKIASIAADVQGANPSLSAARCRRIASTVVRRYFKTAEDLSPLLYGDRATAPDGPLTQKVKGWSPPDLTTLPKGPQGPGEGSQEGGEGSGGEGGGEGAGGAGGAAGEGAAAEGAGAAGEAAELAPLLLL